MENIGRKNFPRIIWRKYISAIELLFFNSFSSMGIFFCESDRLEKSDGGLHNLFGAHWHNHFLFHLKILLLFKENWSF